LFVKQRLFKHYFRITHRNPVCNPEIYRFDIYIGSRHCLNLYTCHIGVLLYDISWQVCGEVTAWMNQLSQYQLWLVGCCVLQQDSVQILEKNRPTIFYYSFDNVVKIIMRKSRAYSGKLFMLIITKCLYSFNNYLELQWTQVWSTKYLTLFNQLQASSCICFPN